MVFIVVVHMTGQQGSKRVYLEAGQQSSKRVSLVAAQAH